MIKFRAWDKKTKTMYEVKSIVFTLQSMLCVNKKAVHPERTLYLDDNDTILMQYTGLKDKNGVEIFEGDVVKSCRLVNGHIYEYVGQVKFVDFSWNIVDKKDTYDPFYNYTDDYPDEIWEIEVIGNIYENPELIESVEE